MPTRRLAGLFLEFALPAQRRELLPHRATVPPIRRSEKFRTNRGFVDRLRNIYRCGDFAAYVEEADKLSGFVDGTHPTPATASFDEGILFELRICDAIVDWVHRGSNQTWLGNARMLAAAHQWVVSDDEARRQALFDTTRSRAEPLPTALISCFGQDYEHRIAQRRQKAVWMCEQAFSAVAGEASRWAMPREEGVNLAMGRKEAAYLLDLLHPTTVRGVNVPDDWRTYLPEGFPGAHAPLPAGWREAKAARGIRYYYHESDPAHTTTWTRPGLTASDSADTPP